MDPWAIKNNKRNELKVYIPLILNIIYTLANKDNTEMMNFFTVLLS